MLTTATAFLIMITNPVGNLNGASGQTPIPFMVPGQSSPTKFTSMNECDAELASIQDKQLRDIHAVDMGGFPREAILSMKARASSMECKLMPVPKADDPEVVQPGEDNQITPTKDNLVEVWKIGRFDTDRVFHGTDENNSFFKTQESCSDAFHETVDSIRKEVRKSTGSTEQAKKYADGFAEKYDCQLIVVDKTTAAVGAVSMKPGGGKKPALIRDEIADAQEPDDDDADEQVVPAPELSNVPRVERFPLNAIPRHSPAMAMPSRTYRMAEFQSFGNGQSGWIKYASVYAVPYQCWAAIKQFRKDEQQTIVNQFQSMVVGTQSAQWYNRSMNQHQQRRLTCVVDQ